jgi:spoIIIJ-associated protein
MTDFLCDGVSSQHKTFYLLKFYLLEAACRAVGSLVMVKNEVTEALWLETLLSHMGFSVTVLVTHNPESVPGAYMLLEINPDTLRPTQIQQLLGSDGQNLDALQCLTNATMNSHLPNGAEHRQYVVDLNGYRAKREQELKQLAVEAAEYVRLHRRDYVIQHLSSSDRRQVHAYLEAVADVETFSQGREPHRHLIVRLVGSEPQVYPNETITPRY